MDASNTCSCDNKRAQIESGPGGATNTVIQGLTAKEERLMIEFIEPDPRPVVSRVNLDRWRGLDVDPFGGA